MPNEWKKFLDTNLLLYLEDKDDLAKNAIAIDVVNSVSKNRQGVISIQVLAEFSNKMTGILSASDINERLVDYQKSFQTLAYSSNEIRIANEFYEHYKIHFFDALIAATMKTNDINTIVTENKKDFERMPWLKVINPFDK